MKKTYDLCAQYMKLVEEFCCLYVVACSDIPENTVEGRCFRVSARDAFKEVTGLDLEKTVKVLLQ